MAQPKTEKPSVATFGDHEVITPTNELRMAVSTVAAGAYDDPVARAEQALAQLSGEFGTWMNQECERLDQARRQVNAKGFNKATREALFLAAHDIKGEGDTFGFPAAVAPADSLCRLIEHTPDMTHIPLSLVDQHVDAIRAIIREHARPDTADVANALFKRLREVTDEFLAYENRERPDVLETILGPPLQPDDRSF